MSRHILVSGGAGYIGSHTCKLLARQGYTPITLDNLVYGHRRAVRWGPFIEGCVGDKHLVAHILREHAVRAVIHFAGYAYVGESMQEPGKYFHNNIANTLELLDAMDEAGVRVVVFSSSCATYGYPERIPIGEDQAQRPVNPYGESKLFIERALHWYACCRGFRYAALRYFNAAGADPEGDLGEQHDPETHLIPLVIQAALGERPYVEIFGTDYPTPDGTAVRDYIHVTDLAQAHVRALQALDRGPASLALNLGTGRGHSVRQVIAAVERVCGGSVPVKEAARRAGDPAELVADPGRARQHLDWTPHYSDLDTIVETAWQWFSRRHGVEGEAGRGPDEVQHGC